MPGRIVIIGSGFSGLVAASMLERVAPGLAEVTILEATGRPGGRIRTGLFDEWGVSYDAGCAEFYDITRSPHLRRLVQDLGIPTTPMVASPYFYYDGNLFRSEADLHDHFGGRWVRDLEAFWEKGTSIRAPEEYARAGHPGDNEHPWSDRSFSDVLGQIEDPRGRHFTAVQVHSDLATEPHLTNGTFGFDNLLIDHPDYCSMYVLEGGNERLISGLAERCSSTIRLNTTVSSVRASSSGGFRLETVDGDGRAGLDADVVLVAVPPRQVKAIEWSGSDLSGSVGEHISHHDHGADYLRVTILFRERYWAEVLPEDYFISDAFGGVTVYDRTHGNAPRRSGYGIQSWLIAGAAATRMADLSDEEIVASVLSSLPGPIAAGADMALESRVDRWTGQLGVSGLPGGTPLLSLDQRHVPYPGLVFTGDYLYDATVCGALDSASSAVQRVLRFVGAQGDASAADILRSLTRETACAGQADSRSEATGALPFIRT